MVAKSGQQVIMWRAVRRDSTSDVDSDEEVVNAITRLREFSFLSVRASNNKNQAYEMHKLVQEATRYGLSRPEKQDEESYFFNAALQVVSDLFPARQKGFMGRM